MSSMCLQIIISATTDDADCADKQEEKNMPKKTVQQPQWKEVDPKVVIGQAAGKVWDYLYKQSVWTIQRIADQTGLSPEVIKEQMDELVKIGRAAYLEKSPYNEPAWELHYEMTDEERQSAKEFRHKVGETAGQIWHCLGAEDLPDGQGQAGKTAKECRLTSALIQKRIKAKQDYTAMGIGWLACEGKLRMFENPAEAAGPKKYAFCLTEVEQAIYRKEQGSKK